MITITISGPYNSGKTILSVHIAKFLEAHGIRAIIQDEDVDEPDHSLSNLVGQRMTISVRAEPKSVPTTETP